MNYILSYILNYNSIKYELYILYILKMEKASFGTAIGIRQVLLQHSSDKTIFASTKNHFEYSFTVNKVGQIN